MYLMVISSYIILSDENLGDNPNNEMEPIEWETIIIMMHLIVILSYIILIHLAMGYTQEQCDHEKDC